MPSNIAPVAPSCCQSPTSPHKAIIHWFCGGSERLRVLQTLLQGSLDYSHSIVNKNEAPSWTLASRDAVLFVPSAVPSDRLRSC